VLNGADALRVPDVPAFAMTLVAKPLRRVNARSIEQPLEAFAGKRVHAVAGIGHPERFFSALAASGVMVEPHPFADHHAFVASDLAFGDRTPVVMTEKDAVKCESFADERCWYLPVEAIVDSALVDRVVEKLEWIRSSLKSSSAR
jgi:tetraacyldisaccharide 4'-kinase